MTIELPDAGFAERAQVPLEPIETPLRNRLIGLDDDGREVPFAAPRVTIQVEVQRQRRDHCARCRARRVLYRISVGFYGGDFDRTEARCAPCWGIR